VDDVVVVTVVVVVVEHLAEVVSSLLSLQFGTPVHMSLNGMHCLKSSQRKSFVSR
jgi:hypothetical protein